MKVSEKRRRALYAAVNEPIMDLRIKNQQGRLVGKDNDLDRTLHDLVHTIWLGVERALANKQSHTEPHE